MNPRAIISRQYCSLILLLLLLSGCATKSLFSPYPRQAALLRQGLATASTTAAMARLAQEEEDGDNLLSRLEQGRIKQLAGDYQASSADFRAATSRFDELDMAATIRGSRLAGLGAALLVNDNALPYEGHGFERIFSHHFQAYNFLGQNDPQGAAVELRKARLEQRVLLEQHEREVAAAHARAESEQINIDSVAHNFAGLDTIAGQVKNSLQNGYTFYTSAAFWEAQGDFNAAMVDYKLAYEVNQGSQMLAADMARLAWKMGERNQEATFTRREANEGVLVILFEEGFVPARQEVKIPVPTLTGALITMAFPIYNAHNWPQGRQLTALDQNGRALAISEELVDVGVLAVKAFKEELAPLIVRQTLRAMAKYEMQRQANREAGPLGLFGAMIYTIASENADLRNWLTLPRSGQGARVYLAAGTQEITLQSGPNQIRIALTVRPGRTTLLRVVDLGPRLLVQKFPL